MIGRGTWTRGTKSRNAPALEASVGIIPIFVKSVNFCKILTLEGRGIIFMPSRFIKRLHFLLTSVPLKRGEIRPKVTHLAEDKNW